MFYVDTPRTETPRATSMLYAGAGIDANELEKACAGFVEAATYPALHVIT